MVKWRNKTEVPGPLPKRGGFVSRHQGIQTGRTNARKNYHSRGEPRLHKILAVSKVEK